MAVGLALTGTAGSQLCGQTPPTDPSLVLHYAFDEDPDDLAKDLSSHGNDGKIIAGRYLEEVDGRHGVLRFDGKSSHVLCGDSKSLNIHGDMTLEMWVRLNDLDAKKWGLIFGERPGYHFNFGEIHTLGVWYGRRGGSLVLPVDRNILTEQWSHITVVIEYPRCRFYHNGELVRDAYMPIPGITLLEDKSAYLGGAPEMYSPIDLDEFKLYRRALGPAEIAARANGEKTGSSTAQELTIEPDWYNGQLTLRLTCKGMDCSDHTAEMTLLAGDGTEVITSRKATFQEAFPNCGRYVARASFALKPLLNGRGYDAVARLRDASGKTIRTLHKHTFIGKPDWIDTNEGRWKGVPPPWTPIKLKKSDQTIELGVWGRRHEIGKTPLLRQIETRDVNILAKPITLAAKIDGENLAWDSLDTELLKKTATAAIVQQVERTDAAALFIRNRTEYDGYMVFDCEIRASRDLSLEALTLEIPLKTKHATLCFGHRVYPDHPEITLKSFHIGAVEGDLAFRFSPNIWLGDEQRGLCWQAESDENWHNADEQKAIEILPRGDTTIFRAHFVNVPTQLRKGDTLHYKFSLQATPVKPLLRDGWDLRIARSHLWNQSVTWPDRQIEGLPALAYMKKRGIRHIYTNVIDVWPYPLPIDKHFAWKVHRLIDSVHDNDLRIYMYMIHERFPTTVPEFEHYGGGMIRTPADPYPLPVNPNHYYTESQAGVGGCPKSKAYRDAYTHSLAKRLDQYGDNGVYLDGTVHISACDNARHECGYRDKGGSLKATYPVFAIREFMRRLYGVVKQRRADGVIDMHSWTLNASGLAYADTLWTGEQWHHIKHTGTDYISGELTLDMYRTMFMGYQIGVAADTLAYRLTSRDKTRHNVLSIALLHDVPVRALLPHGEKAGDFLKMTLDLWDMRDRFGAKEAEKLFYWNNQEYVSVSPADCHATLMKHPKNGILSLISNLRRDAATVSAQFNLKALDLRAGQFDVSNALTKEPIEIKSDNSISMELGSEEWIYVQLRPK